MLVGGMVGDVVHDDFETTPVGLRDQLVKDRQVAEEREDVGVIGHVVAEVRHRRGIDRRHPDGIDAQCVAQVFQLLDEARQVAHAIAGRVFTAAHVDDIDSAGLPPRVFPVCHFPSLFGRSERQVGIDPTTLWGW